MKKLGYVSVNLVKDQERVMSREIADLDLKPVSEFPFHVTLMYDEQECEEPRCVINPDVTFEATVIGFKPLGKAIVMELHSIGLHREFKRLAEAGYKHSFGTALLHMSLVYNPDDYTLEIVKTGMDHWLGKTLQFTNETVRDLQ